MEMYKKGILIMLLNMIGWAEGWVPRPVGRARAAPLMSAQ